MPGPPRAVTAVIRDAGDDDVRALVDLWREAGLLRPWNDPGQDIALARATPSAAVRAFYERAGYALEPRVLMSRRLDAPEPC